MATVDDLLHKGKQQETKLHEAANLIGNAREMLQTALIELASLSPELRREQRLGEARRVESVVSLLDSQAGPGGNSLLDRLLRILSTATPVVLRPLSDPITPSYMQGRGLDGRVSLFGTTENDVVSALINLGVPQRTGESYVRHVLQLLPPGETLDFDGLFRAVLKLRSQEGK